MKLISQITKNHANKWRDFFLDLIFPIECLSCKKEKHWLCPDCFKFIKFSSNSHCPACKRKTHCGQYCIYCQDDYSLNGIFVAGNYHDKIIKSLIKNLKYNLIKDIGPVLGDFLSQYFIDKKVQNQRENKLLKFNTKAIIDFDKPNELFNDLNNVLVIPVPLHARRFRWRGFNQAELIAEKFAENLKLNIDKDSLIRIKHKKAQAKLKKEARIKNIKDCFAWQGEKINKKIILIDDITTTGSTLNEAAKILKENNALEVWGLVIAKN